MSYGTSGSDSIKHLITLRYNELENQASYKRVHEETDKFTYAVNFILFTILGYGTTWTAANAIFNEIPYFINNLDGGYNAAFYTTFIINGSVVLIFPYICYYYYYGHIQFDYSIPMILLLQFLSCVFCVIFYHYQDLNYPLGLFAISLFAGMIGSLSSTVSSSYLIKFENDYISALEVGQNFMSIIISSVAIIQNPGSLSNVRFTPEIFFAIFSFLMIFPMLAYYYIEKYEIGFRPEFKRNYFNSSTSNNNRNSDVMEVSNKSFIKPEEQNINMNEVTWKDIPPSEEKVVEDIILSEGEIVKDIILPEEKVVEDIILSEGKTVKDIPPSEEEIMNNRDLEEGIDLRLHSSEGIDLRLHSSEIKNTNDLISTLSHEEFHHHVHKDIVNDNTIIKPYNYLDNKDNINMNDSNEPQQSDSLSYKSNIDFIIHISTKSFYKDIFDSTWFKNGWTYIVVSAWINFHMWGPIVSLIPYAFLYTGSNLTSGTESLAIAIQLASFTSLLGAFLTTRLYLPYHFTTIFIFTGLCTLIYIAAANIEPFHDNIVNGFFIAIYGLLSFIYTYIWTESLRRCSYKFNLNDREILANLVGLMNPLFSFVGSLAVLPIILLYF